MLERIKEVLVKTANVDESKITLDASLKDDLGVDSLDSVEIVLELETEFDVRIDDSELENLNTVGDILKLIEEKTN